MSRRSALAAVAGAAALGALAAVSGAGSATQLPPPPPLPPPSDFVAQIDNRYFPLERGTTFLYRGRENGEAAVDTVAVTDAAKTILGIHATVVLDRTTVGGKPSEKTFDWYAQDKHGNVWYLGEAAFEWKNGRWVKADDSWQAGVDGAKAGIIMQGQPKVGDVYRQEYYPGHAEDVAANLSLKESLTVPYGSFDHVLLTKETTPLEPDVIDHKDYARGVGEIAERTVKGGNDFLELVSISHG
jgi:hypothetical protein